MNDAKTFILHQDANMKVYILLLIFGCLCLKHGATNGLASPHDTPPRFEQRGDLSTLKDWAKESGVSFADGVGFSQSKNNMEDDWSIGLKNPLLLSMKKGTIVLSVPKDFVLSSSKIFIEMGGDTALGNAMEILKEGNYSNHKGEFLLFLKILKEREKREASKWSTWINCLPKKFSTGVCFDTVELDCLPSFSRALADYEIMKFQAFGDCATLLKETWQEKSSYTQDECQLLYKWAYNVVNTRCWKFSDELDAGTSEIVPIGDLFNHKKPANVAVDNLPSSHTIDFVLQEGLSGTTELSLSYGLTNPHRFLTIFGFVDESMPEIFCQVVFPGATSEHKALGCDDRSKMVYNTVDGAISDTIWDSVLYLLLASKPDEQRSLYRAHLAEDLTTKKALRYKYALETSLTLKNHVDGTLAELRSHNADINAAKEDGSDHLHLELIEKQNFFLQDVFGKVNAILDTMVQEETRRRRQAAANVN